MLQCEGYCFPCFAAEHTLKKTHCISRVQCCTASAGAAVFKDFAAVDTLDEDCCIPCFAGTPSAFHTCAAAWRIFMRSLCISLTA